LSPAAFPSRSIPKVHAIRVPAHNEPIQFAVEFSETPALRIPPLDQIEGKPVIRDLKIEPTPSANPVRWKQELITRAVLSPEKSAYVMDEFPFPSTTHGVAAYASAKLVSLRMAQRLASRSMATSG
jgi:hypothetical protein